MPLQRKTDKIFYIEYGNKRVFDSTTEPYLSMRQSRLRKNFRLGGDGPWKMYKEMKEMGLTDKDLVCVWVENFKADCYDELRARLNQWRKSYGDAKIPITTLEKTIEKHK